MLPGEAELAVGGGRPEAGERGTAGADDELADPRGAVRMAGRVLRCEALVVAVVAR